MWVRAVFSEEEVLEEVVAPGEVEREDSSVEKRK